MKFSKDQKQQLTVNAIGLGTGLFSIYKFVLGMPTKQAITSTLIAVGASTAVVAYIMNKDNSKKQK